MKMFENKIYINRRLKLKSIISEGIILFLGNDEEPYNYKANTYHFRQDSTFSYFFGLTDPGINAIIDIDENKEILFGDNIDFEDVIWMGNLPTIQERALKVGIYECLSSDKLGNYLKGAIAKGRKVNFLPPYRASSNLKIQNLLNLSYLEAEKNASVPLIKAVIELRSIKEKCEIDEIERMIEVAYNMHTSAMIIAKPGVLEREIAGKIEGIAISSGNGVSFPVILSMNGEILHNHSHHQVLQKGRLLVVDAGSESELLYASDITRTIPIGGKFDARQKDIYNIVLAANVNTIEKSGPNTYYKDIHMQAAKIIASGLIDLGLMKGNIDDIIAQGAHALFFPHGLGHMMGLDVHDMEGLGETFVGYDETISRSDQFGLAYLRFAKKPKPGYVLTDEPGIYFIPALIDLWQKEKKFTSYINYEKLNDYRNFGGIRIEDDILITENGCKLLGKPIPKTVKEIEDLMN
jgi:Xaa-Pro aminopeptidase